MPGTLINFYTDLNQLPITKEEIDCILLLDVLEHCKKDEITLQSILESGLIKDNALFIITVPAFPLLFSTLSEGLKNGGVVVP